MPTRGEVIEEARSWLGTPFHVQGSAKGVGCDCAGLVIGIAKELGLIAPDFDAGPYSQQPHNYKLSSVCGRYMQPIPIREAQAGDVIEIRFKNEPQHLGVLVPYPLGGLAVVHALTLSKKVVEHRLDVRWQARCTGAYALPGIA